jgi:hypothetical protein
MVHPPEMLTATATAADIAEAAKAEGRQVDSLLVEVVDSGK